mgnify:CR=1 FL=1
MEQSFAIIEDYLMVRMPKEVDHHETAALSKKADEYLMNDKVFNIVFDLEDTKLMDRSGIGIIVGRYRKVECFGGKVIAINCNRQIRKILDLSGLHKYIEIMN